MDKTPTPNPFWESVGTLSELLADLIIINICWILLTLLVVSAPPAMAGVYYATYRRAKDLDAGWPAFKEGFKQYWKLSYGLALINLVVIGLTGYNIVFYYAMQTTFGYILMGVFFSLLMFWLMTQMYIYPLLFEQEEQSLRTAMRNSLALIARKPLLSVGLLILLGVIALLSTIIQVPWAVFTGALCAYLVNRYALGIIDEIRQHQKKQAKEI